MRNLHSSAKPRLPWPLILTILCGTTIPGCPEATRRHERIPSSQPAEQVGIERRHAALAPPSQSFPEDNQKLVRHIIRALFQVQAEQKLDLHEVAPWFIESSADLTRVWFRPRLAERAADNERKYYQVVELPHDKLRRPRVETVADLSRIVGKHGDTSDRSGESSPVGFIPEPRVVFQAVSAFTAMEFSGSRAKNVDRGEYDRFDPRYRFDIPQRADDWLEFIQLSPEDGSFEHLGWCPLVP